MAATVEQSNRRSIGLSRQYVEESEAYLNKSTVRPLGFPSLSCTDGVLRGTSVEGHYPVFHNSLKDRRATHKI
jgi:hypothetical protein